MGQLINGKGKSVYDSMNPTTREFVRDRAKKIHFLARRSAQDIHDQGKYLTEVKERLDHGGFLEWLEEEFAWSDRTARHFMTVYDCFKLENFSNLNIDISALYLIAAPKTPEPVRAELIKKAEAGERITHTVAKTAIEEKKTVVVYTRATATVEPQQVVVHTNVLPPAQSQNVIEVAAVKVLPAPPDVSDEEEEEDEEPIVNPAVADEPREETLPATTRPALPVKKESADERHCREDCETAVGLADGKAHSVVDIAKVIGRGDRSVEVFLSRVKMLPWLTVEKVGVSSVLTSRGKNAGSYRFTVDEGLRAICDGRAPRPRVSGGIPPAKLKQIIDELHRRRKENNEKKNNRPVNLSNILKVEMISTANWIEEALAELYKQYQV